MPAILSVVGIALFSYNAVHGISGILMIIAAIVLIIDNIEPESWNKNYRLFYNLLSIFAFIQAFYGLLQYFLFVPYSSPFPIIGTFDNPAGYAICLSMLLPYVLYKEEDVNIRKWIWKGIVAVLCVGTIILSESRAGILSMLIVIFLWLYDETKLVQFFKNYSRLKKIVISTSILFVLLSSLYFFKPDSANGRLLIWRVSSGLICNASLLGSGSDSFLANYMEAQANYLEKNENSKFAILADNTKHPFNEYILLLVEYGIAGLLIFVIYALYISHRFKANYNCFKKPAIYSLLSLLVVSCFSYPTNYPFAWILASIAVSTRTTNASFVMPLIAKLLIIAGIVIFVIVPIKQKLLDEKEWYKIANISLSGKTSEVLSRYERLYRRMKDEPLFLYNYGAELSYMKEYVRSNNILLKCEKLYNSFDIQMLIVENCIQIGKYKEAESRLILASHMIPNSLAPQYQLMILYDKTGKAEEAIKAANKICNKNIKIYSQTSMMMRERALSVINKYEE